LITTLIYYSAAINYNAFREREKIILKSFTFYSMFLNFAMILNFSMYINNPLYRIKEIA